MLDNAFDAARSWMMCPTLKDEVMAKAAGRGADVVVFDLEDGVPPHAKAEARAISARMLPQLQGCSVMRINDPVTAPELAGEDVRAVAGPALRGIMVPKVESAEALTRVYEVLQKSGASLPDGFEVIPLIETPAGVERLDAILQQARNPWLGRVAFGAGDYTAVLGVEWSHRPGQLLYARSRMAAVSSANGLSGPIDSGSPLLEDREAFIADGLEAKLQGFKAKFCIHPRQIEWVHALFDPSEAEVQRAKKVVEAFEKVEAAHGALIGTVDGWMIDPPIVKHSFLVMRRVGLR